LVAHRIEREILIEAPVDLVWKVVTQAEHISGWFSRTAEVELTPGGRLALHWDGYGTVQGRVERVEPPHFFSFRWAVRPDEDLAEDNSTLVEFTLRAEGESTRLTVVETGFGDLAGTEDERRYRFDDHSSGWDRELGELEEYLK
jgi:uncharacterized protein YndB with AHSA1/START domain